MTVYDWINIGLCGVFVVFTLGVCVFILLLSRTWKRALNEHLCS